ncbi:MAG TPA: peptidoglycan recognition family protein, partial [Candidatus Paceibacterota bacterium]|nr:peptidoglycan recognition family protein [Candidatus Paceibacterota bacterium]
MTDLKEIEIRWERLLDKPDWYLTIVPEVEEIRKCFADKSKMEQDAVKKELYDFFELHLENGVIALGKNPPNTDVERKPIDTIVIHHTSNPPGMSKDRLSSIELIRLYAPYFYEPKSDADKNMKGRPIYSGHARDGKQVFWPYHWFIRKNGEAERLLKDNEIGWHAGNWDINCRSVAVCFDGDYENSRPSDVELEAATRLIRGQYPNV